MVIRVQKKMTNLLFSHYYVTKLVGIETAFHQNMLWSIAERSGMSDTFHSATGNTFVSVMGGTFNPLLSIQQDFLKSFLLPITYLFNIKDENIADYENQNSLE